MPGSATPVPDSLPPAAIIARVKTVAGVGSGLDADTVRGRAPQSEFIRFDFLVPFARPPGLVPVLARFQFGA